MNRCRVGDVCRVVRAVFPENIDRFCEVVEYDSQNSLYGVMWVVQFPAPVITVTGEGGVGLGVRGTMPDTWLQPMRPPGEDTQDITYLPEEETA